MAQGNKLLLCMIHFIQPIVFILFGVWLITLNFNEFVGYAILVYILGFEFIKMLVLCRVSCILENMKKEPNNTHSPNCLRCGIATLGNSYLLRCLMSSNPGQSVVLYMYNRGMLMRGYGCCCTFFWQVLIGGGCIFSIGYSYLIHNTTYNYPTLYWITLILYGIWFLLQFMYLIMYYSGNPTYINNDVKLEIAKYNLPFINDTHSVTTHPQIELQTIPVQPVQQQVVYVIPQPETPTTVVVVQQLPSPIFTPKVSQQTINKNESMKSYTNMHTTELFANNNTNKVQYLSTHSTEIINEDLKNNKIEHTNELIKQNKSTETHANNDANYKKEQYLKTDMNDNTFEATQSKTLGQITPTPTSTEFVSYGENRLFLSTQSEPLDINDKNMQHLSPLQLQTNYNNYSPISSTYTDDKLAQIDVIKEDEAMYIQTPTDQSVFDVKNIETDAYENINNMYARQASRVRTDSKKIDNEQGQTVMPTKSKSIPNIGPKPDTEINEMLEDLDMSYEYENIYKGGMDTYDIETFQDLIENQDKLTEFIKDKNHLS
eukprot:475870_1